MSYQLKVVFRGPMVFVPSAPIDQPQPWVGAFLVNADQTSLSNLGQDRTLPLHFPFVRYDLAALKGAPSGIDGKGYWKLAGEDVVIRPASSGGGPLTVAHSSSGTIGTQPAPGEEAFFDWVPPISALVSNGNVLPSCLQAGASNEVVARVHLLEGSLQSETLSKFNNEYVIMQFTHLSSGGVKVRRVVTTSVSLTMDLTGDFELRARQYGTSNVRKLVFADPGGGTLEIEVINLCADEMQDPLPAQFPGLDSDFAWNYLLTEAGNPLLLQNGPIRLPLAVQFDPGTDGGGEFAKCTYPQASPISATDLTTMQTVSSF